MNGQRSRKATLPLNVTMYRDRLKSVFVVGRNFSILLLNCPAWVLLSKIYKPFSSSLYMGRTHGQARKSCLACQPNGPTDTDADMQSDPR